MFTGIIETLGQVVDLKKEKTNLHIFIKSSITNELKIDQSVAHNGVCLTVVEIKDDVYKVTAVAETLKRTNFENLQPGDFINLERSMQLNGRFDGHIVQGHVDCKAECKRIVDKNGSWDFYFNHPRNPEFITVEKGSICINGVSLTVVDSETTLFLVTIIPYTYENTNFKFLKEGDLVNIEFDIIGKYVARLLKTS